MPPESGSIAVGNAPRTPEVLPSDLSRDPVVKIMRFTVAGGLGVTPPIEVQCITCDRGAQRPPMLEDTLGTVMTLPPSHAATRRRLDALTGRAL